jgi:hypothetical protein
VTDFLIRPLEKQSFDCRHYRYEQKLARLLWKVDHKEIIEFPTDGINSNSSFEMRMNIQTPGTSVRMGQGLMLRSQFSAIFGNFLRFLTIFCDV